MREEKLAIIVATKDRPDDIRRLLRSIERQDCKPAQIVVVDGGICPVVAVQDEFANLPIMYVRKVPASLTAQRNAGIGALSGDVTLVAFLDDDIIVEEGGLRKMASFFAGAPDDVGGAAFNIMNDRYKKPTILERLFLVNADRPGRIMRSGFQSKLCSLPETTQVQWLVGCAMVYRRKVFDEFRFDEYFAGYARYEDVDFSYRVGKRYRLFVVSDARVRHLNSLEPLSFSFALGKMEFVNRLYFTGKSAELSLPLCYWALFGLLLNNVLKGVFMLDRRYMNRARGNIAGLLAGRESG